MGKTFRDERTERILNSVWNKLGGFLKFSPVATATIINNQKTVAGAGSAEALAGSTAIRSVTVRALLNNVGTIYVGDSSVSSSNGFELGAGDSVDLDVDNLNKIFLDTDTNGEGVSYIATV